MSSNKMEQSLDDILKASKTSRRGRSSRRSGAGRPAAAPAPVGGVAKSTKQGKPAKAAPAAPAAILAGETKIMVSNLVRFPPVHHTGALLTRTSQGTLTKSNSRYVRPMQVFEPTLLASANTTECDTTNRARFRRLPVWMLSHDLQKIKP